MKAEFVTCQLLRLIVRVMVGPDKYEVEYDGRGWCYEDVLVDGQRAIRRFRLFKLPPRLEFRVGGANATLERRFTNWKAWETLRLIVNGELVYDIEDLFRDDP